MCAFHEIQRCKNLLMWTFWGERNETSLLGHQSGFFLLNLIEDPLYIKLECKWSPHVHTKCIPYEHLIENSLPWNKDFFLKTKMGKKRKSLLGIPFFNKLKTFVVFSNHVRFSTPIFFSAALAGHIFVKATFWSQD